MPPDAFLRRSAARWDVISARARAADWSAIFDAGEIVEQFLHLRRQAAADGRRLTSLVFMGMGEPMHNLDNVIASIRRIADPDLGGLGWRQVTVSTVGIVPGIDALADADLNVHLALSLHAADDETRTRLVPMNRRYPIADIMAAARRFGDRTGRVPTIEYCMLAGVNDSDDQADRLSELMRGFRAHVNLIPYNPIADAPYARPSSQRAAEFLHRSRAAAGVVAHLRETRGDQINAACGQLRRRRRGRSKRGWRMAKEFATLVSFHPPSSILAFCFPRPRRLDLHFKSTTLR